MLATFSHICFDEPTHRYYTAAGIELVNPSRLVEHITPPFDAPSIAARVAHKQGRSTEEVLADWGARKAAGQARGNQVHRFIAAMLRGEPWHAEVLPEMDTFTAWWQAAQDNLVVKAVEWVIGDVALGIAGTLDALFYNARTQKFELYDWKTGGKFRMVNAYGEMLLPPFEELEHCEHSRYSIQIGLYRLILERNLDIPLGLPHLVHLDSLGGWFDHYAYDIAPRHLEAWLEAIETPQEVA